MMKKIAWINFGYAALLLTGGLFAAISKQSIASLLMSASSALLLTFFGFLCLREKKIGWQGSLGVAFLLDGIFTFRFLHTEKFFPSGLLCLLSLLYLAVLVTTLWSANGKKEGKADAPKRR